MIIDLNREKKKILEYLFKRIEDYAKSPHTGLGKEGAPVTHLHLGYQFDQNAWIALVFDTRPDGSADGEWTLCAEDNHIAKDLWSIACGNLENDEESIHTLELDNSKQVISEYDEDKLANLFGNLLKDCLITAKREGFFQGLPTATNCLMAIEEVNGGYGWPTYQNRITEGSVR